jgi:excisionase family DNA binding protein
MSESAYFTVNELADHFGVNPKTIYRRLWAKGIPAYKVGRIWRIAKFDLQKFQLLPSQLVFYQAQDLAEKQMRFGTTYGAH